ncbi:uncharacterized protein LOC133178353 [Saccostrea echinata]|uniref:uncharacterized protein LOC133178353 n=1 Tax=Saccostrea echinata TaxID=191078 RepID=UPI002A829DB7|nr:uncharacterized protein LOC133178353 [Saccostrea echinata]
MFKIYIQPLLILGMFVDLSLSQCPSPIRAKVKGYRRKLTILGSCNENLDMSFHMIPDIKIPHCNKCESLTDTKVHYLHGNKTCSLTPPTDGRSTESCPHHLQINYDRYRIPRSIAQVKCNCDNCITKHYDNTLRMLDDGVCQEVMMYRQVLRECKRERDRKRKKRRRSRRNKVYTIVYEKYPVACTCKLTHTKDGR